MTLEETPRAGLVRHLGILGLAATGICSMMGAGINIVPFAIQRNVPIGPYVLPAYLFAALPALLAALAYAMLASAMPRAGGSYLYASRGLSPYLGFVASFSQWFGLCIAIGVISYVIVPFLRDIADALDWSSTAAHLDNDKVRVPVALGFLWLFVAVNILGLRWYERTLLPLMFLMFLLGSVVIVAGLRFDHEDYRAAAGPESPIASNSQNPLPPASFQISSFLTAAAILFSSFIGFDSIAQAGGEARNPRRTLPLAIAVAFLTVGSFYFLFTASVYHAVPWDVIAKQAQTQDVTAPGLLAPLLHPGWTIAIVAGAAIALINDLPAMLLSVSRLMFSWARDGIFPRGVGRIHPRWRTPHHALIISAIVASFGIVGCSVAGDFFLGVDILVTSMLVNFLLMCISVLTLPMKNPSLARQVQVITNPNLRRPFAAAGAVLLAGFLGVHVWKDLSSSVPHWSHHSTLVWLAVLAFGSLIFFWKVRELRRSGVDLESRFSQLPEEDPE